MYAPWLLLALSLIGAGLTYNVRHPFYAPSRRAVLSFFLGWLTIELALHHIVFQGLVTAWLVWAGALHTLPGVLGLTLTIASWVVLGQTYWRSGESAEIVERALKEGLGPDYRERVLPEVEARFESVIRWKQILVPFPIRDPEVERIRDIRFVRTAGINLKLDVYRHRSRPASCPTLLQVHGGGWVLGSKNEQGLPLMHLLAQRGWVCVSADYRLSPHATFPDQLIDLKRALTWVRTEGKAFGADPNFVVVTGGSAGGHLASLVALTANEPGLQPGFENADTSVQGCVSFYGVYDFTDRNSLWPHPGLRDLVEKQILKASQEEAPHLYEAASPIARVHANAPPFFVIHGELDTMVPVAEARIFSSKLREISRAPVVYAEIPGAQHAFEIFPSLRSLAVIHGVERFLGSIYSGYLRERTAGRDLSAVEH
jgi:acetyl esterase/lipase